MRDSVQGWAKRDWPPEATEVAEGLYEAWVDMTFGMYRDSSDVTRIDPAIRLDRPYTMRPADWYINPENMSKDQIFYQRVCTPVASWTVKLRDGGNWDSVVSPGCLYPPTTSAGHRRPE